MPESSLGWADYRRSGPALRLLLSAMVRRLAVAVSVVTGETLARVAVQESPDGVTCSPIQRR